MATWTIDETTGLPYLTEVTDFEFTDWERNDNGYPQNISVWKKDTQNYGIPWIYGYAEVPRLGNVVNMKIYYQGASDLERLNFNIQGDNELLNAKALVRTQ